MSKERRVYTAEFKREAIALAATSSKSIKALERELGIGDSVLRGWIRQAQVVVTFLSDRAASGMVLGTVEGLLSWRRTAPPAFVERMQPHLQEIIARCNALDPVLTMVENAFALEPDEGQGLFGAAVVMADGRVLMPINFGLGKTVLFDPATDTISVTTPASATGGFAGGALLADGTVLLLPGTYSDLMESRIWEPETDTYVAAPELATVPALGLGAYLGGCVLPDGRVVFTPWYSRRLVVWEPEFGASYGRDVALAGFWNRRP